MKSLSQGLIIVALVGSFSEPIPAQTAVEAQFAAEVESGVRSVSAQPELLTWKASYDRERTEFAHYETDKDFYEVDSSNQWCATSVTEVHTGLRRTASFYVPEVMRGALPPLPAKQDSALTASCYLGAIWYEMQGRDPVVGVVGRLTAAWGPPAQPTRNERSRNLLIGGAGLWKDVSMWHRGGVTIWIGWTDWRKNDGAGLRSIAWVARDRARDFDLFHGGVRYHGCRGEDGQSQPGVDRGCHAPTELRSARRRNRRWAFVSMAQGSNQPTGGTAGCGPAGRRFICSLCSSERSQAGFTCGTRREAWETELSAGRT